VGTYRGAISTSKLLSGREIDCSGKGMFSSQDRAYVVGQYVPKYGPELVSHALSGNSLLMVLFSLLAFRYIRFDQKKMFCLAQCNIVNFPHFFFLFYAFHFIAGKRYKNI
jgi:hypothetical protein